MTLLLMEETRSIPTRREELKVWKRGRSCSLEVACLVEKTELAMDLHSCQEDQKRLGMMHDLYVASLSSVCVIAFVCLFVWLCLFIVCFSICVCLCICLSVCLLRFQSICVLFSGLTSKPSFKAFLLKSMESHAATG